MIKIEGSNNEAILVKVNSDGGLVLVQERPSHLLDGGKDEIVVSADQVESLIEAIRKLQ